ncbi:DUF1223 domain-containing protein [Paracoccus kondratievae]|uniref:DUF1223 domain-containing protein n=1 Tax=Paracoccus kondratievae TaxID=135740 RepID=A0AAD3NZD5_9RHOB|nr:DUF1223 domain-containing protein [Paracoccus kondratievae]QFQ87186.1 DUF1223 domain-containing protein [Paracoccus kondratievae]GLK64038.1 hypothetical protein GCM10017635_15090 [Paracoccus kondratievae]
MAARRIKISARGQACRAGVLPVLACAAVVALTGLGVPAFAHEMGEGPAEGATPVCIFDTGAADVAATLSGPAAELPSSGEGAAPASTFVEIVDEDGVIGLIEAPKGEPGVPADQSSPVMPSDPFAAPGVSTFAEVQPRARMIGPVGQPPVVVELFTSQGCSSCPPADELLADLAEREDVLTLSWHVDYWDYLGWADEFARPEFTLRQQAYAHQSGERAIYTPQIVVGGTDTLIALRPAELVGLVQTQMAWPTPVMVSSSQGKEGYRIELTPRSAIKDRVAIILVRYAPQRRVAIRAGENRGKVVNYRNVVLAAERIAEWDGRAPLRLTVRQDGQNSTDFPDDTRHAILAQELGRGDARMASGPILAAIRLD